MLVQTDVTARVELEDKLADLTGAQLNMLEQLFPRHIIEYMLLRGSDAKSGHSMRQLAHKHEQVRQSSVFFIISSSISSISISTQFQSTDQSVEQSTLTLSACSAKGSAGTLQTLKERDAVPSFCAKPMNALCS